MPKSSDALKYQVNGDSGVDAVERTYLCPDCGQYKPAADYYYSDGQRTTYCKPCHNKRSLASQRKRRAVQAGSAIAATSSAPVMAMHEHWGDAFAVLQMLIELPPPHRRAVLAMAAAYVQQEQAST